MSSRNALDTGVGRASTMASSSVAQSKWNKANVSLKLRIFDVKKVRLQLKQWQQLILATMNVKQVRAGRRKGSTGRETVRARIGEFVIFSERFG